LAQVSYCKAFLAEGPQGSPALVVIVFLGEHLFTQSDLFALASGTLAKGHNYGASFLLVGLALFIAFVVMGIGPFKGYLIGSIGLIIVASGITLVMNEEDVDMKWVGYMWLAILAIIGLLLGVNYYGIGLPR